MNQDSSGRFFREIASVASSLFDPEPIQFRSTDEIGVRSIRNACKKSFGTVFDLKRFLNRNAFLVGCLDFTEYEPVEHLIIGLGYRNGSTSKVYRIIHESGSKTRVAISTATEATIHCHLAEDHKAEVLVFHNHPSNDLRRRFDNIPIASDLDRQSWLLNVLKPLQLIKALNAGGRFLCYLGENGFVREFRTPRILDAIQLLRLN